MGDNIFYVKKGKSKDNITTPFWSEEKLNRPIQSTRIKPICSITAHVLNSFGLNLNQVPYFESTNSSLLRKCALWNFHGKCLPFTSIAELFYNHWKTLFLGHVHSRSKQILPNMIHLGWSSLNMKQKKKIATKNSLKESGYWRNI